MRWYSVGARAALCLFVAAATSGPCGADEPFGGIPRGIAKLFGKTKEKTLDMKKPADCKAPDVEDLARQIDWMEHHIETFGTAVPKQPDVWGEARMTRHREEFERQLATRFDAKGFDANLQGALRRSDQALFATALTLQQASSTGNPASAASNSAIGLLTADGKTFASTTTAPTSLATGLNDFKTASGTPELTLEPTLVIDQLQRYLNNINQIRRQNEGDDTADSPGYGLNLVRVPISVLPGKRTRKGYGAEVTLTAEPRLTDDLLPKTFRNLVINDALDQLSLPLAQFFNNDPNGAQCALTIIDSAHQRAEKNMQGLIDWARSESEHLDSLEINAGRVPRSNDYKKYVSFLDQRKEYLKMRFFLLALAAEYARSSQLQQACVPALSERTTAPKTFETYISLRCGDERLEVFTEMDVITLDQWAESSIKLRQPGPLTVTITLPGTRTKVALDLFWKVDFQGAPDADGDAAGAKSRRADDTPLALPLVCSNIIVNRKLSSPEAVFEYKKLEESWKGKCALALVDVITRKVRKYGGTSPRDQFVSSQLESANSFYESILSFSEQSDFGAIPSSQRPSRVPMSASQFVAAVGVDNISHIALDLFNKQVRHPIASQNREFHLTDIRRILTDELQAAYDFLESPRGRAMWDYCQPEVAHSIRTRNYSALELYRHVFCQALPSGHVISGAKTPYADSGSMRHSVTGALAWIVIVNAALLNERLIEDARDVAAAKGCACLTQGEQWPKYFLPAPPPAIRDGEDPELVARQTADFQQANDSFKQYVRCRWPVRVFALDPGTQDQNVADIFSRRREMQLAVAVGLANGKIGLNAASKFTRQLETDVETIAINRTAVAFSHGTDTFGWRFYPRFQSPETPSNLTAFGQTLFGGPDRDHDIRDRQLEPGIRECTAIIVMPSFVPYVDIHSRTNWFSLTNPRERELTMSDTMKLSRNCQAIKEASLCVQNTNCYRAADVAQLHKVIDQLDRRMPMQQMLVQVPFNNTTGGFELFSHGITDLAPALHGWYGAPGVRVSTAGDCCKGCEPAPAPTSDAEKAAQAKSCLCKGTTLFLVGKHFSVLETRVIAGGTCVPETRLLSREIISVTIPANVSTVTHKAGNVTKRYVDVHLATPYGVTGHMLIPVAPPEPTEQAAAPLSEAAKKEVEKIAVSAVDTLAKASFGQLVVAKPAEIHLLYEKNADGTLSFKKDEGQVGAIKTFTISLSSDARSRTPPGPQVLPPESAHVFFSLRLDKAAVPPVRIVAAPMKPMFSLQNGNNVELSVDTLIQHALDQLPRLVDAKTVDAAEGKKLEVKGDFFVGLGEWPAFTLSVQEKLTFVLRPAPKAALPKPAQEPAPKPAQQQPAGAPPVNPPEPVQPPPPRIMSSVLRPYPAFSSGELAP